MTTITLYNLEGHWQPVRSAILATTAGLLVVLRFHFPLPPVLTSLSPFSVILCQEWRRDREGRGVEIAFLH